VAGITHLSLVSRHVALHMIVQRQLTQSAFDHVAPHDQRGTTARSHTFQLPLGAAYDVKYMAGHLHIGGRNIQVRPILSTLNPNLKP